jgi:uncharacterized protein YigE (DUF2233 family)
VGLLKPGTLLGREARFSFFKEHLMFRAFLSSVMVFAIAAAGLATADDVKIGGKTYFHVTITKLDPQKESLTVKVTDKNGKELEKTFQLARGIEYLDIGGGVAKLEDFRVGDEILVIQDGDRITCLKKDAPVTIIRVDAKAGSVTVKVKDKQGNETEKTFQLAEDAAYFDNTGRVATLEVFRSGDHVLIIEAQGKLKALRKARNP